MLTGRVLLLPQIAHGCIVTTNFDEAIEEVYKRSSLAFDGYMHGTQHHNFFSQARPRRAQRILKLHGDADDPQTYILTKTQYTQAYGEPLEFQKAATKGAATNLYFELAALPRLQFGEGQDTGPVQAGQGPERSTRSPITTPSSPRRTAQQQSSKRDRTLLALKHSAGLVSGRASMNFVEKLLRLVIDVAAKLDPVQRLKGQQK